MPRGIGREGNRRGMTTGGIYDRLETAGMSIMSGVHPAVCVGQVSVGMSQVRSCDNGEDAVKERYGGGKL